MNQHKIKRTNKKTNKTNKILKIRIKRAPKLTQEGEGLLQSLWYIEQQDDQETELTQEEKDLLKSLCSTEDYDDLEETLNPFEKTSFLRTLGLTSVNTHQELTDEVFITIAKLVLAGSPQFKEPITDIKTGVDEPYMIIAKVTGAPELTWYKDGVPIPEDPRIKMVKKDAETFELTFQKTAVKDNGNWAVIARNTHGEMSQFFTFAAQMLPKFEAKLQDAEANESKQVVMKCKINCTPRPTIQWFKNGQEITALAPSAIRTTRTS